MPELFQTATTLPQPASGGRTLAAALPGLIVAGALLVLLLLTVHQGALRGELNDPDSYMQIVHLRHALEHGIWSGGPLPRDNAPYGMVLHWSKAYDLLVLAVAAPLAALTGWSAAVAIIAPLLGPLWTAILIAVGVWAAAPVCTRGERAWVGIALAVSPIAFVWGVFGNADHHIPVLTAWTALMGFALRIAAGEAGARDGLGAGLSAAAALWLNVDSILPVCLGLAVMGVAWIRDGAPRRTANLTAAAVFAIALAGALAADPPLAGRAAAHLDRLSIVYVVFALLFAALWFAIGLAPQRPGAWRARLAVGAAGALACAVALALIFPQILAPERSVFVDIDGPNLWDAVAEMLPAFRTPANGVLFMGGPILGFAAAAAFAWSARGSRAFPGWLLFVGVLALAGAGGLYRTRFAIFPEALAALPLGIMVGRLGRAVVRRFPSASGWLWGALLGGPLLIAPVLGSALLRSGDKGAAQAAPACAIPAVADALNDASFMGGRDNIIMTHPNDAPALLYWTGHRTVAGPYHRNRQGIADVGAFMTSRDDGAARAIAARRGIGYVLICPGRATDWPPVGDGRALVERLAAGRVPAWLAARPWPAGVRSDLRLFRVLAP